MTKLAKGICLLGVVFIILGCISVWNRLPVPNPFLLSERQNGFSGVLRLWVCEGWSCGAGSLSAWLNSASVRFERLHDGVYVQVSYVSRATLASFAACENPPDMLLYYPGALETGDGLIKLKSAGALRDEFRDFGGGLCVPVAMGAYVWAVADGADVSESALCLPKDTEAVCYSAALAGLLAGNEEGDVSETRYGVDLGLPVDEEAPKEAVFRHEIVPAAGSVRQEDAYTRFVRGDFDVTVVTQKEIRQLQRLEDSGRAPEWSIRTGGIVFTDQLTLMSVVEGSAAREEMAAAFIGFLLEDAQQEQLKDVRALRVTDGAALYARQRGMGELEAAVLSSRLVIPDPFGNGFRRRAEALAAALLAGEGGAEEKLSQIVGRSFGEGFRQ